MTDRHHLSTFPMIALLRALFCAFAAAAGLWTASAKAAPPPMPPTNDGSSGKVDEAVRCVSLLGTKAGGPLNLYVARTKAKLPSAVLVLLPDKVQDVKTLLTSSAWQDFAEDNSLDLLAVMSSVKPVPATKNSPPSTVPSQAELVLQAVDHECGAGLPLLLYSGPQQADFVQSILAADSKRVAAWCLRAPAHLTGVDTATAPPGIVVCYKENTPSYNALTADFARARKRGARLSWISLPGDKPGDSSPPALDAFVRNDFSVVLHPKVGSEQWQNIDTKLTIKVADLGVHPEKASYLPHFTLASAWAALHVPGGPELAQQAILEREEDTFNKAQPKLHFYLRKPLSAEKAGGKIEGVLAFCTWTWDRNKLIRRLQNKEDFLVRYAEEHRLALLTWDTAEAWSTKQSADQRSQQENFQDNLDFDQLANAWERGVHVLCHEAGLPENDFLLYGISRGAQWAHRLALRKPEHFLAVHIHINSSYDQPTPAAKNILWLQTTGDLEYGYEAAKRFYERCRDMGYPIIFKAGENLGHDNSPQIEALGLRFFDYALGVRAKRDALASAKSPSGKRAGSNVYALSGLGNAPFYADFINQDVYGANEKDLVPASQRVPLPTQALAQAWGGDSAASAPLLVSNPAAGSSKPSLASAASGQVNHPGPATPSRQPPTVDAPAGGRAAPAGDAPDPAGRADAVKTPAANPALPPAEPPEFAQRYQLAVQHAVTEVPELAQAGSASNAAFLGQYQRLKSSHDALLTDPSWPEQVARLVREQAAAHPNYARELQASIERAVLLYPDLRDADSPLNTDFLAEYQRLRIAGDALLTDP